MATGVVFDDAVDMSRLLRPVAWKLALNRALTLGLRGAAMTLTANAVLLIVWHTGTWEGHDSLGVRYDVAALTVCLVLLTCAATWITRPTLYETLRITDHALSLKDRLTTAYEFRFDQTSIVRLQRAELSRALHGVSLKRAVPIVVPRRELLVAFLALALSIATVFIPDRHVATHAAQQRDHAVTAFAAAQVRHLILARHAAVSPRPAGARKVSLPSDSTVAPLRQLSAALSTAQTPRAALRQFADAQSQLLQAAAMAAGDRSALQALAARLASGPTAPLASAMRSGDPHATQSALRSLAETLSTLTARQRLHLAQTFEGAANAAPAAARQALRDAAFALGNGDPASARRAINDLARQVTAMQDHASALPALRNTARALASIQHDVANNVVTHPSPAATTAHAVTTAEKPGTRATHSAGTTQPGAPGRRTGGKHSPSSASGESKSPAVGHVGAGRSSGSPVSASARSAVARAGALSNAGSGFGAGGSSSGRGAGSSGSTGAGGSGGLRTVYLPGKRLAGPGSTEDGPLGATVSLTSPGFKRVVAQYAGRANIALGKVALPPALQGEVKQYFTALQSQ